MVGPTDRRHDRVRRRTLLKASAALALPALALPAIPASEARRDEFGLWLTYGAERLQLRDVIVDMTALAGRQEVVILALPSIPLPAPRGASPIPASALLLEMSGTPLAKCSLDEIAAAEHHLHPFFIELTCEIRIRFRKRCESESALSARWALTDGRFLGPPWPKNAISVFCRAMSPGRPILLPPIPIGFRRVRMPTYEEPDSYAAFDELLPI